jgi:hypothetical protein
MTSVISGTTNAQKIPTVRSVQGMAREIFDPDVKIRPTVMPEEVIVTPLVLDFEWLSGADLPSLIGEAWPRILRHSRPATGLESSSTLGSK